MKRAFLPILLSATAFIAVHPAPAVREIFKMKQPNGEIISVRIEGDEFAHLYRTTDGHALAYDADGYLRYAVLSPDNTLSTHGAPIARDPQKRTSEEANFVRQLPKIDFTSYYINNSTARQAVQRRKSAGDSPKIGNFPTQGKIRSVVILAEFADNSFTLDREFHNRLMNEEGFSDGAATGSAHDYFTDQSSGTFHPEFDVVGPVKLDHEMAFYGANSGSAHDKSPWLMIGEACEKAHEQLGCDFSKYDNDNDGSVDMVYVIYAGYGEHSGGGGNTIWPHKYSLSEAGIKLTIDGKKIDTYACSSELSGNSGAESSGIGTFCHEFSHVLGLPDLYMTQGGSAYLLWKYSVMVYGCYNNRSWTPCGYTAFERHSLGWLDFTDIDTPADGMELEAVNAANKAYRLTTKDENEYFTVENRQQTGWDAHIPSSGMMITHIDYDRGVWENNAVNNVKNHPRVVLVAADDVLDTKTETEDLFPNSQGSNSFTDRTRPASRTWDGAPLNKWITNITNENGMVRFDFMSNFLESPTGIETQTDGDSSLNILWNEVAGADTYTVRLNKYAPKSEQSIILKEDFSGMTEGTLKTPNAEDSAPLLDDMTHEAGWTGSKVYQAGGYCQLGTFNTGGWIATPAFPMPQGEKLYTIAIKMKAPANKRPSITVESSGNTLSHPIDSKEKTYVYLFETADGNATAKITADKERIYIDEITIHHGNATSQYPDGVVKQAAAAKLQSAQTASSAPDNLQDFYSVEVASIPDLRSTSHRFDHLEPATLYSITVQAIGDDRKSSQSQEVFFRTTSGIAPAESSRWLANEGRELIVSSCKPGERIDIFTTDGKTVYSTAASSTSVTFDMKKAGCYIVKKGSVAQKIQIE